MSDKDERRTIEEYSHRIQELEAELKQVIADRQLADLRSIQAEAKLAQVREWRDKASTPTENVTSADLDSILAKRKGGGDEPSNR